MILTCSSCATRFLVDAAAIGPLGRSVRCARCQHNWFQEPAADLPHSLQNSATETAPSASPTRARAGVSQPAHPTPLRRGANLPALPRETGSRTGMLSWGILAASIAALLVSGYVLREQISYAWPPAAKLYSMLGLETAAGNLRLTDVSFSQAIQSGRPALTVKGVIMNEGNGEVALPAVLVKLRNAAGRDIFQWTYQLPETNVAPGGKIEFVTSLPDPPAEARNLEVTFTTDK